MAWATALPKPPRNLHDVGPMAKLSDSVVSGPVRRVMVGTDRSQTASRAVAWAASFADAFGAELHVVQVVTPQNPAGTQYGAAEGTRAAAVAEDLTA